MQRIGTVMLIDDSEVDLLCGRLAIERAGVAERLLSFEQAAQALEYLRRPQGHDIELILLDINMPGMSGFDFLQAYQAEGAVAPRAAVVMLTSSPNPQDHLQALRFACVKGCLTKPLTLEAAKALPHWLAC